MSAEKDSNEENKEEREDDEGGTSKEVEININENEENTEREDVEGGTSKEPEINMNENEENKGEREDDEGGASKEPEININENEENKEECEDDEGGTSKEPEINISENEAAEGAAALSLGPEMELPTEDQQRQVLTPIQDQAGTFPKKRRRKKSKTKKRKKKKLCDDPPQLEVTPLQQRALDLSQAGEDSPGVSRKDYGLAAEAVANVEQTPPTYSVLTTTPRAPTETTTLLRPRLCLFLPPSQEIMRYPPTPELPQPQQEEELLSPESPPPCNMILQEVPQVFQEAPLSPEIPMEFPPAREILLLEVPLVLQQAPLSPVMFPPILGQETVQEELYMEEPELIIDLLPDEPVVEEPGPTQPPNSS